MILRLPLEGVTREHCAAMHRAKHEMDPQSFGLELP